MNPFLCPIFVKIYSSQWTLKGNKKSMPYYYKWTTVTQEITHRLLDASWAAGTFIGLPFGASFREAGNQNKNQFILIHNADRPEFYPITVSSGFTGEPFIDRFGAFHHLWRFKLTPFRSSSGFPAQKTYLLYGNSDALPADLGPEDLLCISKINYRQPLGKLGQDRIGMDLTSNPTLNSFTDRGGCDRCLGCRDELMGIRWLEIPALRDLRACRE